MGLIRLNEKDYDFTWKSIAIFFIGSVTFTAIFFYLPDWIWLEGVTSKLTVYLLNLLTGRENRVIYVNDIYPPIEPYRILIVERDTGQYLPQITFTKMCTGIHAILIFIFAILFIPHSTIKETSKDIWNRKAKAILVNAFLFYIVNILRMLLQLYLYSIGFEWEDIHYSISAASSFIAIAAILIIHHYVPEFIVSLLWIGDEVKIKLTKRSESADDGAEGNEIDEDNAEGNNTEKEGTNETEKENNINNKGRDEKNEVEKEI